MRLVRRGQALKSQGPVPTTVFGYDPKFKSEMTEHSMPKAKALLDMYGYVDRNGDGYREQPDGSPLVIEYHTLADGEASIGVLRKCGFVRAGEGAEPGTVRWALDVAGR